MRGKLSMGASRPVMGWGPTVAREGILGGLPRGGENATARRTPRHGTYESYAGIGDSV